MTLDEAIKHCEDKSESLFNQASAGARNGMTLEEYVDCKECAREHLQLAAWLTELKNRREKEIEQAKHKTTGLWLAKKVDASHYHYYCSECNFRSKGLKSRFCPACGKQMEI